MSLSRPQPGFPSLGGWMLLTFFSIQSASHAPTHLDIQISTIAAITTSWLHRSSNLFANSIVASLLPSYSTAGAAAAASSRTLAMRGGVSISLSDGVRRGSCLGFASLSTTHVGTGVGQTYSSSQV